MVVCNLSPDELKIIFIVIPISAVSALLLGYRANAKGDKALHKHHYLARHTTTGWRPILLRINLDVTSSGQYSSTAKAKTRIYLFSRRKTFLPKQEVTASRQELE